MRRLSGMDAAFLYLETPTTHMHVHAVMLLDPSTVPGGYSFEKIKAHLASRLPKLFEFRRRLDVMWRTGGESALVARMNEYSLTRKMSAFGGEAEIFARSELCRL